MDGSTELEPINETAAHALAGNPRRGTDEYAALTLQHGLINAAAIWLRASWLHRMGLEEAR